jgi:hypothetical protein
MLSIAIPYTDINKAPTTYEITKKKNTGNNGDDILE